MESNKTNNSQVQGNQNIVIQDVSASNITINVNGKEKKLEVAMNQWLVENCMYSIAEYQPISNRSIEKVSRASTNWQNEKEYLDAGLVLMQALYIGIVGTYLNKIASISNQSFSMQKLKDYSKNAYLLALRLLDLVNIAQISALWDFLERTKEPMETPDKLAQFFEQLAVRDLKFSYKLFVELFQRFKSKNIPFPMEEMAKLENSIHHDSYLAKAIQKIEEIYILSNNQELEGQDVFWVEKSLTDILSEFNFLTNYKIQSIKELDYHHIKAHEQYFIHKINLFGSSGKSSEIGKFSFETTKYSDKAFYTDSVILFKENYFDGLNLFPFLIDYNSIIQEPGINLCVFSHKNLTHDKLFNFISVQHNKFLGIETQDEQNNDYSQIYSNKESIVQHKKNLIGKLIKQAQKTLSGSKETAGSILDDLFN